MPKEEHWLITRLKKLRPVFNAYFARTTTIEHVLPVMSTNVLAIIEAAQAVQAGLSHLEEGHFDSKELSNEFAHLTTFAINLPATIQGDAGYWSYALDLVDPNAFEEGAESVNLGQIELLTAALNRVVAIKRELRDKAKDMGALH